METFIILTDSCANLTEDIIDKYNIYVLSLSYYIDGVKCRGFEKSREFHFKEFYEMMRERKNITTSEVSEQDAYDLCKPILKRGQDILYIGFSSELSETFNMVHNALIRLQGEYPERQIYAVDSLGAALGEGLLIQYAVMEREKGATIDEVYRWAMDNRMYICHEFTVDDLFFLRRGGRISAATAVLGSTLGIKPIMHMDAQGRLVEIGKARGRKKSLDALVNHMREYALKPERQIVCISHGDCEEDARYMAEQVKREMGVKDVRIQILDPVIGAHSGPGTLALFYYGEHRRKLVSREKITHVFIVNPVAGMENFAGELRKKLQHIEGITYYIFSSRYAGYEAAIVRQVRELFLGEKIRFYCCGGSGTLRNMLNAFDKLDDAEIAFYPCGLSNDILKVFGTDASVFSNIEELIHGEVVDVDYIRTNHGICLNSFSAGLDTEVMIAMNQYRGITQLGKQLPYTLSLIRTLLAGKGRRVAIYVDGNEITGSFMEMIFGNGCAIGGNVYFSEEPDLRDGRGDFVLAPLKSRISLLYLLHLLQKRQFDKVMRKADTGTWRQVRIASLDGEPLAGNQDGELVECAMEWTLEIVPKGLHLVVPRGVSV